MTSMAESFSVYPEQIDGYNTLPLRKNLIHEIRAEDHNRLRDAIVKIEQELGIQPSGTFATVRSRLDEIGDVRAIILAHMADPEDAHDASAISVLDTNDTYFEDDVEGVLEELSALVPPRPDVIGANSSRVPNSGVWDPYDGYGIKFVFNTSSGDNALKKTQPSVASGCRGIQIIEVSGSTDDGSGAQLRLGGGVGSETLEWKAPGDSFGAPVDISGLDTGDIETISSADTTKKIRIARTDLPYAVPPKLDTFDVYSFNAVRGAYSLPSEGFKETQYITRTAVSDTATSRFQFMLSGMVFPADRGILVVQKKLRGTTQFFPIAVLDLSSIFNENLRTTGQQVYTPSLSGFDTVLLYDRIPVSDDFTQFPLNADSEPRYENYENPFSRLQIARYLVPASNPDLVGGELTSPEGITEQDADDSVAAFRVLHYVDGSTDFTGTPPLTSMIGVRDPTASGLNDTAAGGETTRISNVYVDNTPTRPSIEHINLRPEKIDINDTNPSEALSTAYVKFLSGIPYYTAERSSILTGTPVAHGSVTDNNKFTVELRSGNDVFDKTYVPENILTFTTDVFDFPSGVTSGATYGRWGAAVDVDELLDDGYNNFSTTNLPEHGQQAFYFAAGAGTVTGGVPPQDRRLIVVPNSFSNHAWVQAILHDPWNAGDAYGSFGVDGYDAYGADNVTRILVNGYAEDRSTDTQEWFTDETRRISDVQATSLYPLGPTQADGYIPEAHDKTSTISSISLQCGGKFTNDEFNIPGLIYPQSDYSLGNGIAPNASTSGLPDYTTATGDRQYQRLFNLGYAINRGKLRVMSGGNYPLSFEEIRYKHNDERDRVGRIDVRIPGYAGQNSTGWLDIGRLFVTGKYNDGDGALNGAVTGEAGDFTVPFTFGAKNSGDTENNIIVRVTLFGQTGEEITDSRRKLITMLQLLPG